MCIDECQTFADSVSILLVDSSEAYIFDQQSDVTVDLNKREVTIQLDESQLSITTDIELEFTLGEYVQDKNYGIHELKFSTEIEYEVEVVDSRFVINIDEVDQ